MKLIPVETPQDFLAAQQFIAPYEETCVSLASLVRRKSDKLVFLVSSDEAVVEWPRSGCIETTGLLGIINLDSTLYHCIPDPSRLEAEFLKAQLPYFLKKPVRCISGEKIATDFLIKIVDSINCSFDPSTGLRDRTSSGLLNHPAQIYDYKMMQWLCAGNVVSIRPSDYSTTGLSGGEEIIRCTEHDMEILHPLQKDYMKDEVAVPGRQISDAEVDITLRNLLKNQLCFALTFDGDIVAKANTNAIGINCVQIGGVYTHPLYRRNGYAGALVQALCNRSLRAHKHPVLFVKEKNMPAFSLYQKLGFEECGHYSIAYY